MSGEGIGDLLRLGRSGLCHWRGAPRFGLQDVGFSPGGAQDLFSLRTGNILLGNDPDQAALELVYPPSIEFVRPALFVLTGAHWHLCLDLPGGGSLEVHPARTEFAPAGARLRFLGRTRGFRSYLCLRPCGDRQLAGALLHRERGAFAEVFSWPDPLGKIRVLEGPEHCRLENPGDFTAQPWMTSLSSSDMGLRLEGGMELRAQNRSLISDVVADGTVQLSPTGPIVLLRHRQTVGGYPRIFNVISADVDLLAQLPPGRSLRFRQVELREAVGVAARKKAELEGLMRRFGL